MPSGCPASCCPAWPTATATRSTAPCAGRTHDGGGTFWTWRQAMYALAARLDPDSYYALARAVYAEMALAGITSVGEFHYVHHAPRRAPLRRPERDGRRAGSRGRARPASG